MKLKLIQGFIVSLIGFALLGCSSSSPSQTKYKDITATHMPAAPELHALDAAFADVDDDGDLDAILGVEMGVNRLYINDGSGHLSYREGVFGEGAYDSEHVVATDFNEDGIDDVIFVAEDDQQHQFFLGNADGTFSDATNRLPAMSEGNALAVGDLNGDDLPDILVGNTGEQNQNFLWLNDPANPGQFLDSTEVGLPQIADNTQSIALADLDGDGDLDMVIGNEDPPNSLYLNDGNAHFTDHSDRLELVTPLETRQVHIRDFTGDGALDILFFNLTSNAGEWDKDPQIRLLVNNGEGRYVDESDERLPENRFSIYAGAPVDLNRDGALDLIFGPLEIPGFNPMRFRAYINDGRGNFTDQTEEYIPENSSGRGWGMAVGDLTGDGLNEILVGGWGTQARLLTPASAE